MTKISELFSDPMLKKFTKSELKKMINTTEVRVLLEKLSLKHDIPVTLVMKALLDTFEKEAKKAKSE